MASIGNDPGGCKRVLFCDGEKRKTIRLGKAPSRVAETVKLRIESILACRRAAVPLDAETAGWIGQIDDTLHGRLARCGLVSPRKTYRLGQFLDEWIASRQNQSPYTIAGLTTAARRVTDFFGGDIDLRDVTPKRAAAYKSHLTDSELAPATVGRDIKRAKQFFLAAIKAGIITGNPFADVSAPSMLNRARIIFIDVPTIEKVIAVAPGPYWRLIIALSRFGGLRVPSEIMDLEWEDVNWAANTIRIREHKTAERLIPIFAELRPHLEVIAAECGPIIDSMSHRGLRENMMKITKAAGVEQWPRVWHNLRASRQTELLDRFPEHVVSEWLGNSQKVGRDHYAKAHAEHYLKAAQFAALQPSPAEDILSFSKAN